MCKYFTILTILTASWFLGGLIWSVTNKLEIFRESMMITFAVTIFVFGLLGYGMFGSLGKCESKEDECEILSAVATKETAFISLNSKFDRKITLTTEITREVNLVNEKNVKVICRYYLNHWGYVLRDNSEAVTYHILPKDKLEKSE